MNSPAKHLTRRGLLCVTLLCFCLFSTACGPKIPKLPSSTSFNRLEQTEGLQQFSRFVEYSNTLSNFQGTLELELKKNVFRKTSRLALAFDYPDSLRAELIASNLASPTILILVNNNQIKLIDRNNRVVWEGQSSDKDIEKIFSLPFITPELMRWISGGWPMPNRGGVEFIESSLSKDKKRLLFRIKESGNREIRLLVDAVNVQPKLLSMELWLGSDRKLITIYNYGDESRLPVSLKTWLVDKQATMQVKGIDSKINPSWKKDLKRKLFSVKIPKSFERRAISELVVQGLGF